MDLPVNKIHRILLDAGLPSTIENLKNPTEEYIMALLTSFLSRYNINMNLINQVSLICIVCMYYIMYIFYIYYEYNLLKLEDT